MFLITNIEIKDTQEKGRGVFATSQIGNGTVIGDYLGRATNYTEIEEEDIPYMMFYDDKFGITPDRKKPGIHLLNHSCEPNCFMFPYKGHMLFVAIKDINPQEELTVHYLYPPKDACQDCDHICLCQSPKCIKTMHTPKDLFIKWRAFDTEQKSKTKPEKKFENGCLLPLTQYPEVIHIAELGLDLDEML